MRLGVLIPPTGSWSAVEAEFRWAESVGYDVGYVYDHLTHPTVPGEWLAEGFTTLAAAAAITRAIDVGTLVASATLHSPVALARLAATVDDIAGGRLVLGLGAGSPRCAAADRDEQPSPREMADQLADVVLGLRAVQDGATSWRGRTRGFSGLETASSPPGARRPFLMLAAHGPRSMALAAEHADGWNTYGGPASVGLEPAEYWRAVGEQVAAMDRACAKVGRDPGDQRRSLLLGYGTLRPAESVDSYLEAVERARNAGFDELVVYGPHSPAAGFASDPEVHRAALARLQG